MSTERIIVVGEVAQAFTERFTAKAQSIETGDPRDGSAQLGAVVDQKTVNHVNNLIDDAVAKGATLLSGGKANSVLMPATVVDGVTSDMALYHDESFGPVVGIMKVADDAEALRLMNDSPYGLTASVWTDDYDIAAALGAQIETGTVFMNRADYLDPALCWTGCKDTGRGGSLSYLGFHSVTRPKSYHLKKV